MIWSRSHTGCVLALVSLACAGCPAMGITRGAEMAASSTFDDRSYAQQVADDGTKADIEKNLVEAGPGLARTVNVDVYRGRVMLTGSAESDAERRRATEIARRSSGVVVVYDDIQIAPGGGLVGDTSDFVTNKELGANLLAADGLSSQSFEHRVVNSVAYILGQATSEAEIEIARRTAEETPGVGGVVLHIDLREP